MRTTFPENHAGVLCAANCATDGAADDDELPGWQKNNAHSTTLRGPCRPRETQAELRMPVTSGGRKRSRRSSSPASKPKSTLRWRSSSDIAEHVPASGKRAVKSTAVPCFSATLRRRIQPAVGKRGG